MELVRNIRIKHFKSLEDVEIKGCKRYNLFVGRPNVGKSNLLEALALHCIPFVLRGKESTLRSLVRAEHIGELFFDGNTEAPILVDCDSLGSVTISSIPNDGAAITMQSATNQPTGSYALSTDMALTTDHKQDTADVKVLAYRPTPDVGRQSQGTRQLFPPAGPNLMEVVRQLPQLKDEISQLMASYGLKMVFDNVTNELKAMKQKSDEIFLIPFNSLADSLQRMIFYKAAIQSNHGKVICLEEPETHTFPPYIASVMQDVIDSEDNQFFISTHSPYVANCLMEGIHDDLAIWFVNMRSSESSGKARFDNAESRLMSMDINMENGVTTVRRATDDELKEIIRYGVDIFFNMETYL